MEVTTPESEAVCAPMEPVFLVVVPLVLVELPEPPMAPVVMLSSVL